MSRSCIWSHVENVYAVIPWNFLVFQLVSGQWLKASNEGMFVIISWGIYFSRKMECPGGTCVETGGTPKVDGGVTTGVEFAPVVVIDIRGVHYALRGRDIRGPATGRFVHLWVGTLSRRTAQYSYPRNKSG